MWQFAEAVAGIGEACRALDMPITGGNVSLYNETDGKAILPTPVLGVVGVLDDASNACVTRHVQAAGDVGRPARRRRGRARRLRVPAPAARPAARDGRRRWTSTPRSAAAPAGRRWRPTALLQSAHDCCGRRPRRDAGRVLLRHRRRSERRLTSPAVTATADGARPEWRHRRRAVRRIGVARGRRQRAPEMTRRAARRRPRAAGVPATVIGTTGGDRLTIARGWRCGRGPWCCGRRARLERPDLSDTLHEAA